MKYRLIAILFFISGFSFSQSNIVGKISKAVMVSFVADNTGCFGGEVVEYKFVKKNKCRSVTIIKKNGVKETKEISSKNYTDFISNFKDSYNKFKNSGSDQQTCTSISAFILSDSKNKVSFTNVTCEAEFNPEMFLQNLFRLNDGTKQK